MANAYLFFGKAGSGKGTQAQELKKYLESQGKKVIYIETGSLFRALTVGDSLVGKRIQEIIGKGGLMPVFFPVYLWSNILIKNFTGEEEIIMDGVARRVEEAVALQGALDFFKIEKRYVVPIEISDETAMNRLMMRDQGRPDDASRENIQKRLDWYRDNVVPVLEYFKSSGTMTMHEINGEPSVDDVRKQVFDSISIS